MHKTLQPSETAGDHDNHMRHTNKYETKLAYISLLANLEKDKEYES
jgi:hypothetical protein